MLSDTECPIVHLSDFEQRLAKALSREREAKCREANAKATPYGGLDVADCDIIGVTGELAFCKLFGTWPDLTTTPRKGGHDTIYCGQFIDVKTRGGQFTDLLVKTDKRELSEGWFALMQLIGEAPTGARFLGFFPCEDTFQEKYLTTLNGNTVYLVPRTELLHSLL